MSPPIAFVLLHEPAVPDLAALLEALRQRHPDLTWTAGSPGPNRPRSPFILCGRRIVVLMPVEAPLPVDEEVWVRAATAWPEAHEAVARHRAHVIVSLISGGEGKVEDAKIVTAVVGGLVSITAEARGVVFCGRVARSSQIWFDMSARAFAPYPDYPFMLWIDIVPFDSSPQSIGAITFGLSRFTGREIEFEIPRPVRFCTASPGRRACRRHARTRRSDRRRRHDRSIRGRADQRETPRIAPQRRARAAGRP
jgi:hypothetical protein